MIKKIIKTSLFFGVLADPHLEVRNAYFAFKADYANLRRTMSLVTDTAILDSIRPLYARDEGDEVLGVYKVNLGDNAYVVEYGYKNCGFVHSSLELLGVGSHRI